jgi:hypothetical protein
MLAPPNKMSARPTRKELQEEADRLLALYEEPEEESVDGVEDVSCRYRLETGYPVHPNYTVARHTHLAGAHLWNGVKPEKNARRPCCAWQWVATLQICHPENRETYEPPARCECPDCSRHPANLIELHADEPPLPARLRTWAAPVLVELGAEAALAVRLADGFRHGAMPSDAFVQIAGWRRFLPGLWRDGDAIVAAVLRCAFLIRDLYDVMSGDGWTVDGVAEACRALHPDRKVLRQPFLTPDNARHERDEIVVPLERRRIITRDDVTAARIVIQQALRVKLGLITERQRWKSNLDDGGSTSDWTLICTMLRDGLSARETAKLVSLGHSIVSRRFEAAIAAISSRLGPVPALSGQNGKLARGVGTRRAGRTDHPRLTTGERPAALPDLWERLSSDNYTKRALPDDHWLIAEALEYFGDCTVPPGCADGVVERVRVFDSVVRSDPDDDDAPIIGKTDALRTEGRHVILYPCARDWRAVARQLPDGPDRKAALKQEDAISGLLTDEHWPPRPYWPNSKPTKRWGVAWQHLDDVYHAALDVPPIKPIVSWPRPPLFEMAQKRCSNDVDDDDYAGAVVARNGEFVSRRHDSGPKVERDLVDRFNAAITREDGVPH